MAIDNGYCVFKEEVRIKCKGAAPKVLKFNKVYMITHRRSGLLIFKFAL